MPNPKYLGDGVYALFDGYHIWLAVNDVSNLVVALEPAVIESLKNYFEEIEESKLDPFETAEDETY